MASLELALRYESPYGAFSFSYPDNWKCERVGDQLALYALENKHGAMTVSAHMIPETEVSPAGDHLSRYLADKDVPADPTHFVTWTDHDTGRQIVGHGYQDEADCTWRIFFTTKDRKVVMFTYTVAGGVDADEMLLVERVVQSLQL